MKPIGVIDSVNLRGENLEGFFIHHEHYSIEVVKSKDKFNHEVWSGTFNKSLTRNIVRACIIHTHLGLSLPLKTQSRNKKPVVEFAGLHGYNERSKLLKTHFEELENQLQHTEVTRIDVAFDYPTIPNKVFKALKANREPFTWKNSTYYKTGKEGKKNYHINIVAYDKALKENLPEPKERLEVSFGSRFFKYKNEDGEIKTYCLKDLPIVMKKMEKAIKRMTGVTAKIEPIISHA